MLEVEMKIELDGEMVSKIVHEDLVYQLDSFKEHLEQYANNESPSVFSMDREEDIKQLREAIKAFEFVVEYYSA